MPALSTCICLSFPSPYTVSSSLSEVCPSPPPPSSHPWARSGFDECRPWQVCYDWLYILVNGLCWGFRIPDTILPGSRAFSATIVIDYRFYQPFPGLVGVLQGFVLCHVLHTLYKQPPVIGRWASWPSFSRLSRQLHSALHWQKFSLPTENSILTFRTGLLKTNLSWTTNKTKAMIIRAGEHLSTVSFSCLRLSPRSSLLSRMNGNYASRIHPLFMQIRISSLEKSWVVSSPMSHHYPNAEYWFHCQATFFFLLFYLELLYPGLSYSSHYGPHSSHYIPHSLETFSASLSL